ncbi:hypothetical protein SAMN06264364_1267 [Quadrisphaera granulorum]|uniref:Uncharacterized protein n=1 Tax=Quadrisphaera granulorum TaxID=317664 RepID=A0A315ZUT5_9ACTN|nr:hypothetical protein [Quadrisphaera granulorum]PWJ49255.1 hypothetical protein BXY45_1267 [Quadrisphaera granulorum]SZE98172.1 hypothetical protein SAMN06264364_1267 [Quadrisphaera granulorum]
MSEIPHTGDATVDAALDSLRGVASAPDADPLAASRALAAAHAALRARLADSGVDAG